MRKLVSVGLLTVLVLAALGDIAAAAKKKAQQRVEGSVAFPAYVEGQGCFFRLERTLAFFAGDASRGIVGDHFEVDPKTAGKNFVLEVTGGAGVDLDISFYQAYMDPNDPTAAPANFPFETREEGGEAGVVPPGFEKALVCLAAGSNARFLYTAGKGVKAP